MSTPDFVKAELTRQVERVASLATLDPSVALSEGSLLKQDLDMFETDESRWTDTNPVGGSLVPSFAIQAISGWDSLPELQRRLRDARNNARIAGGTFQALEEEKHPIDYFEAPSVRDSLDALSNAGESVAEFGGAATGAAANVFGRAAGAGFFSFIRNAGPAGVVLVGLVGWLAFNALVKR